MPFEEFKIHPANYSTCQNSSSSSNCNDSERAGCLLENSRFIFVLIVLLLASVYSQVMFLLVLIVPKQAFLALRLLITLRTSMAGEAGRRKFQNSIQL